MFFVPYYNVIFVWFKIWLKLIQNTISEFGWVKGSFNPPLSTPIYAVYNLISLHQIYKYNLCANSTKSVKYMGEIFDITLHPPLTPLPWKSAKWVWYLLIWVNADVLYAIHILNFKYYKLSLRGFNQWCIQTRFMLYKNQIVLKEHIVLKYYINLT